MSTSQAAQLATLIGAVRIDSAAAFSFAGVPATCAPQAGAPAQSTPESLLAAALSGQLYHRGYSHPFYEEPPAGQEPAPAADEAAFLEQLSQANQTQEKWGSGWRIGQILANGQLLVQKGDATRTAQAGEYLMGGPGLLQTGQEITIRIFRESRSLQPGFYLCFSEALGDQYDDCDLLRLYFNTTAASSPDWIRLLTSQLNRYEVPFRLKCVAFTAHHGRRDSMVLYFAKRYFPIISLLLSLAPAGLLEKLNPAVPLFTKPLLPGIGLAEEPGTGESFGIHRCRLLAEGLVQAWSRGASALAPQIEAVRQRFAADGLNLDAPYLNAGSADIFALPSEVAITL